MTTDLDTLLARANPLDAEQAERLPIGDAQDELLRLLVIDAPAPPRRRRRRRLLPRLALAAAVLLGLSIALGSLGRGPAQRDGTAWAAELVRYAEASPLLLLPGWAVTYADERSARDGEMRFARGGERADLHWRPGRLSEWERDRAASAQSTASATVLGTTATVYRSPDGRGFSALWRHDGRVLEFSAQAAGLDAFRRLLGSLRQVDTDAWLSALPDSVVKSATRSAVVAEMLRGVTVPPGFEPGRIRGADLSQDRYQLGAAVAGTVACEWFARWSSARRSGDATTERQAVAALATAEDWPILAEMARTGAYPEVLIDYAAAMPSGRWYGRPLEGDVDTGLGCSDLGVPLR